MVKVVLEDGEEKAIGDSYNIEVMRRNRLRCSYDSAAGRQLRKTNSPVVASWLHLNYEDIEDNNMQEIFTIILLGCSPEHDQPRDVIAKRNIEETHRYPMEFITVTGELRPVNLTCVAVGEFGSNTQVVTVNVIGK